MIDSDDESEFVRAIQTELKVQSYLTDGSAIIRRSSEYLVQHKLVPPNVKHFVGPTKYCETCERSIEPNAAICPDCGHFYPPRSRVKIVSFVLIIAALICAGYFLLVTFLIA